MQQAHEEQSASSLDKKHGRIERRTIRTTAALNDYRRDWPGLAQVVQIERRRLVRGVESVEVSYFITSLDRERADASQLLALIRSHWQIENGLHYVRDVTLGEDASRVRSGSSPEVMAALRNTVVHLLEQIPTKSKAAAMQRLAAHPAEAIQLILT